MFGIFLHCHAHAQPLCNRQVETPNTTAAVLLDARFNRLDAANLDFYTTYNFRPNLILAQFTPPDSKITQPKPLKKEQEEPADTTLSIKPISAKARDKPVEIEAEEITGNTNNELQARTNAQVTQGDLSVRSQVIVYESRTNSVRTVGPLDSTISKDNHLSGENLFLDMSSYMGSMDAPTFAFARTKVDGTNRPRYIYGEGTQLLMKGKNIYEMKQAKVSTCDLKPWRWHTSSTSLFMDYNENYASAWNTVLRVGNVPVLYLPYIDFSLDDKRKSGFLTPDFTTSSANGVEISVPFYLNLQPNTDATITGRYLSKRGNEIQTEIRHLTRTSYSEIHYNNLPSDRIADTSRSSIEFKHEQALSDRATLSLYDNRISDDFVYRDLVADVSYTSRVNLPRQGDFYYQGGWWSSRLRMQEFQTLDTKLQNNPLPIPYRVMPGIELWSGKFLESINAMVEMDSQFIHFNKEQDPLSINRFLFYPRVTFPFVLNWLTISPKIGVHLTQYDFQQDTGPSPHDLSRVIPIYSIDAHVAAIRDFSFFGSNWIQTLEPRLLYLHVPFEDQKKYPLLDTAIADQTNSQRMFNDNLFAGQDRVANAKNLVVDLASKLLDPKTGAEAFTVSLGQIFYLNDQKVQLNYNDDGTDPALRSTSQTNTLLTGSGSLTQRLSTSFNWLYDFANNQQQSLSASFSYKLSPGRIANLSYQTQNSTTNSSDGTGNDELVDASTQWYLGSGWYVAGRERYSTKYRKAVQHLLGLEYNPGCLAFRIAVQKLVTGPNSSVSSFFLELELMGLARAAIGDKNLLKNNVGGYTPSAQLPTGDALSGRLK